jgi:integrase
MSRPRIQRRPAAAPSLLDAIAAVQRAAGAVDLAPPINGEFDDETRQQLADQARELHDARGYRRTLANAPGELSMHRGRTPKNKGLRYPPDPPTVQECIAMLAACPQTIYGRRLFAAIVLLWQGALRAFEALALVEGDLDTETGRIQIRNGKGGKQATIKMAAWAWPMLEEWREIRRELPNPRGSLLCVLEGPTAGRTWSQADMRHKLKEVAVDAGVTKRMSCHQMRHAFAVQADQDGMPLKAIQNHLRHENVGITDAYLQGLGLDESLDQVYQRAMPTVPATALLALGVLKEAASA